MNGRMKNKKCGKLSFVFIVTCIGVMQSDSYIKRNGNDTCMINGFRSICMH
jgi:hypothetical protein